MLSANRTVAIFGATGGTGLAVLQRCLDAGFTVNVLARTPSKLAALSAKYPNLNIIEGSIYHNEVVKSTLIVNRQVVDIVISAIGMGFAPGWIPKFDNKHICEEGTQALLTAIYELEREQKVQFPIGGPEMVLLSTTGISSKGRNIPYAMIPIYYGMMGVPHDDKKKMEDLMVHGEGSRRRWVIIRPSLLLNGSSKGLEKIRSSSETPKASLEKQDAEDNAIGYSINREDVGLWIFENCVKKDTSPWQGKMVILTY